MLVTRLLTLPGMVGLGGGLTGDWELDHPGDDWRYFNSGLTSTLLLCYLHLFTATVLCVLYGLAVSRYSINNYRDHTESLSLSLPLNIGI